MEQGCRQKKTESGVIQREVTMKVSEVYRYKVLIIPYISLMSGKEETGKLPSGMVKQLETEEPQKSRVRCYIQCAFLWKRMMIHFHLIACASYVGSKKKWVENDSAICFICHMTELSSVCL